MQLLNLDDLPEVVAICEAYPDLRWNEQKLADTLLAPSSASFGALVESQLSSFCIFNVAVDEAELLVVATHPQFQNQGQAKTLLKEAIDLLRKNRIHKVFLEVRASNANAVKLYEQCGFKKISTRPHYYDHSEDAIVYQLTLTDD